MNIGIVTTWFERGAAVVSRAYWEVLAPMHHVFIYARGGERSGSGDPKWDQPYVTWGRLVPNRITTFIDWADFERWLIDRQIDVVIFNEQHSWDVILRCLKLPIVVGAYVDYYTAATVPFFRLYDFLLCNTRRHYDLFAHHPQAIYIPWGTDCQVFQPNSTPPTRTDVRFFHSAGMGGVGMRKGTDLAVRAFQKVTGNARLIIHSQVGVDTFGEVAALIENDPRIEFIEATVGAPGLYHCGDVYIYPSRLEGIGLTIAEALACGLPVITTDNAPMNEFIQENVNGKRIAVERYQPRADGYYWPESICSEEALTAAMQWYVNNPAQISIQQRQARAYAMAHLNWHDNCADLPHLISRFVKIEKPPSAIKSAQVYERAAQANLHMAATFSQAQKGNWRQVRYHLIRGLWRAPHWLRNRGVWSIAIQAYLMN